MPTKEYYQKHKETLKEYRKEYYKNNKKKENEYSKEYKKEYYKNNQEHITEYKALWYEKNKESIKEYRKEYNQTDTGKKSHTINSWKRYGLICDNYEALYDKYINCWECDNCGIELVSGNYGANKRCMDHCHKTGKFRNILCLSCNLERGKDDRSNN